MIGGDKRNFLLSTEARDYLGFEIERNCTALTPTDQLQFLFLFLFLVFILFLELCIFITLETPIFQNIPAWTLNFNCGFQRHLPVICPAESQS